MLRTLLLLSLSLLLFAQPSSPYAASPSSPTTVVALGGSGTTGGGGLGPANAWPALLQELLRSPLVAAAKRKLRRNTRSSTGPGIAAAATSGVNTSAVVVENRAHEDADGMYEVLHFDSLVPEAGNVPLVMWEYPSSSSSSSSPLALLLFLRRLAQHRSQPRLVVILLWDVHPQVRRLLDDARAAGLVVGVVDVAAWRDADALLSSSWRDAHRGTWRPEPEGSSESRGSKSKSQSQSQNENQLGDYVLDAIHHPSFAVHKEAAIKLFPIVIRALTAAAAASAAAAAAAAAASGDGGDGGGSGSGGTHAAAATTTADTTPALASLLVGKTRLNRAFPATCGALGAAAPTAAPAPAEGSADAGSCFSGKPFLWDSWVGPSDGCDGEDLGVDQKGRKRHTACGCRRCVPCSWRAAATPAARAWKDLLGGTDASTRNTNSTSTSASTSKFSPRNPNPDLLRASLGTVLRDGIFGGGGSETTTSEGGTSFTTSSWLADRPHIMHETPAAGVVLQNPPIKKRFPALATVTSAARSAEEEAAAPLLPLCHQGEFVWTAAAHRGHPLLSVHSSTDVSARRHAGAVMEATALNVRVTSPMAVIVTVQRSEGAPQYVNIEQFRTRATTGSGSGDDDCVFATDRYGAWGYVPPVAAAAAAMATAAAQPQKQPQPQQQGSSGSNPNTIVYTMCSTVEDNRVRWLSVMYTERNGGQ